MSLYETNLYVKFFFPLCCKEIIKKRNFENALCLLLPFMFASAATYVFNVCSPASQLLNPLTTYHFQNLRLTLIRYKFRFYGPRLMGLEVEKPCL